MFGTDQKAIVAWVGGGGQSAGMPSFKTLGAG